MKDENLERFQQMEAEAAEKANLWMAEWAQRVSPLVESGDMEAAIVVVKEMAKRRPCPASRFNTTIDSDLARVIDYLDKKGLIAQ